MPRNCRTNIKSIWRQLLKCDRLAKSLTGLNFDRYLRSLGGFMTKKNQEIISVEQQTAIIDTKMVIANSELANNLLGRIEAFDFISKLTTVGSVKLLAELKESRKYIGLTYFDNKGNCRSIGTWAEFCKHKLHSSKSSVDERIINFKLLGEEFLETSQSIGLGVKDLRKLRQLPKGKQVLIIESEAIELGDKGAVKELIEDIVAANAKVVAEKDQELQESKTLANARQNLLTKANDDLAKKSEELELLIDGKNHKASDWKDQVFKINLASTSIAAQAIRLADQLDELTDRILTEELDPEHSDNAMKYLALTHVDSIDKLLLMVSELADNAYNSFAGYIEGKTVFDDNGIGAVRERVQMGNEYNMVVERAIEVEHESAKNMT